MRPDLVECKTKPPSAGHTERLLTHPIRPNRTEGSMESIESPEQWRPVVGYEGLYEVSDHGNVRSLDRNSPDHRGGVRKFKGRKLRPGRESNGKWLVGLCRDGKAHSARVHRLVAEAFLGPAPEGAEVCHRDDNNDNNKLSNLYWGTRSDNLRDAVRNGRHWQANKTHCKWGHEFTPENTAIHRSGGRQCRACRTARSRRRRAVEEASE